jgi:hypothetical protein
MLDHKLTKLDLDEFSLKEISAMLGGVAPDLDTRAQADSPYAQIEKDGRTVQYTGRGNHSHDFGTVRSTKTITQLSHTYTVPFCSVGHHRQHNFHGRSVGDHRDQGNHGRSVGDHRDRGDHGFKVTAFYYEVEILPFVQSNGLAVLPSTVTIGIGSPELSLVREIGTCGRAFGFRSKGQLLRSGVVEDVEENDSDDEDEDSNSNSNPALMMEPYGSSFGPGDVVGCGLTALSGKTQIFFTKNGEFLGFAVDHENHLQGNDPFLVYVSLHRAGESAIVNLHGPFKFDMVNFLSDQWRKLKPRFDSLKPSKEEMLKLVQNYFLVNGYEKTWLEMSKAQFAWKKLAVLSDVRSALQDGRVSDAKTIIQKVHPTLLSTHIVLACALDCQQFVELLRFKSVDDAISFAGEYLSKYHDVGDVSQACRSMIENVMCLLAYSNTSELPEFVRTAMDSSQRIKLADFAVEVLSKESAMSKGMEMETILQDLINQELDASNQFLKGHMGLGMHSFQQ